MQVMQSEFAQSGVLIGQQQDTQSFGVSDDPMLMSMLSTGFYGNPLRTMIQEVMFNSWDAHHMGNCTDRPIEISLSDTAITFRDYGPGISPDQMHPIYCIYGNSTKRKDSRLTGGFGLGSKSPFAYTETFTVTSFHAGTKVMYHITRASDANGGKPGLTPLVEVPTEETGLMVTVPLQSGDRHQAKEYLYDLLFLSGIKAKIRDRDSEPNEINAQELAPGDYWMAESKRDRHGIYAVYGGVKYEIPEDKLYADEFKFLALISSVGSLYIGFAPDSLTPLPNREGLNMSLKTKENIRAGLERATERFQQVFEPLVQALVRDNMDNLSDMEPQFALYKALGLMQSGPVEKSHSFISKMENLVPYGTDPKVWKIGLQLVTYRLESLVEVIGHKKWAMMTLNHFTRVFPDHKHLAFAIRRYSDLSNVETGRYTASRSVSVPLTAAVMPEFARTHFKLEQEICSMLGEKAAKGFTSMRLKGNGYNDSRWRQVLRERSKLREVSDVEKRLGIIRKETKPKIDEIWDKEGKKIDQLFSMKIIVIAKTASALQETSIPWRVILGNDIAGRDSESYVGACSHIPVAGYVVHEANGAYDATVKLLRSKGYTLVEGPEPNRKAYVRKADQPKPKVPSYPIIAPGRKDWVSHDADNNLITTETPSHYLYATASLVNGHDYYMRRQLPEKKLIRKMLGIHPNIVICHSSSQSQALEKRGVKSFLKALEDWYENQSVNKYRFRNIVRAMTIESGSNIANVVFRGSQDIQKALHLVPVAKDDTAFWEDVDFYASLSGSDWTELRDLRKKVAEEIRLVREADPLKEKIRESCKASQFVSNHAVQRQWEGLPSDERDEFAKKIARIIRAF